MAKLTGSSTMKQLCFVEDGVRHYKGEGSFVFTAYSKFTNGVHTFREEYFNYIPVLLKEDNTDNAVTIMQSKEEACITINSTFSELDKDAERLISEIPSVYDDYYVFHKTNNGGYIKINNCGDAPTNFVLKISNCSLGAGEAFSIGLSQNGMNTSALTLKSKQGFSNCVIYIDSKNWSARAMYNNALVEQLRASQGTFFQLPNGESEL